MAYGSVALRFVIGTVFVLAGLAKLPRRADFEAAVRGYGLISSRFVRPVSRAIPAGELIGGTLILVGLGTRAVAVALAAALVSFSAAVAINLLKGRQIDCGCFAIGAPRRITWITVVRNVVLAGMAVAVAARPTPFTLDAAAGYGRDSLSFGNGLATALTAMIGVFALGLIDEARQLRRSTRLVAESAGLS